MAAGTVCNIACKEGFGVAGFYDESDNYLDFCDISVATSSGCTTALRTQAEFTDNFDRRRRFHMPLQKALEFQTEARPLKTSASYNAGTDGPDKTYCDRHGTLHKARCLQDCSSLWPTPRDHVDALIPSEEEFKALVVADLTASFGTTCINKCSTHSRAVRIVDLPIISTQRRGADEYGMAYIARRRLSVSSAGICTSRRRTDQVNSAPANTASVDLPSANSENFNAPLAKGYLVKVGCCMAAQVWVKMTKLGHTINTTGVV